MWSEGASWIHSLRLSTGITAGIPFVPDSVR